MTVRLGSLFSGVGGFEQGFEAAGFQTTWQVEIDPVAQSVLRRHYSDTPLFADVREVGAHNLTPVDVITFGSPCQDLSIAGKRAGLEGARSGLFFEALRIVRELRPRFAVWENVAGALSSSGGADFAAALDAFAEIGALDIAWRVLDAQFFGVPQRRRRIFVIADFGSECAADVLLEPEGVRGHPTPCRTTGQIVAALTANGVGTCGADDNQGQAGHLIPMPMIDTARCLSSRNERYDYETETFVIDQPLRVANTISAAAGHHGHSSPRGDGSDNIVLAAAWDRVNVTSAANRTRVAFDRPSNTLHARGGDVITAARTSNEVVYGVRRLTPRECERLMGWPDDWTRYADSGKQISDSHRYRLCGNGVAAPVTRWIAERMAAVLAREQEAVA